MRLLFTILLILSIGSIRAQIDLRQLIPDSTQYMIPVTDSLILGEYYQKYRQLADPHLYIIGDSICFTLLNGIDTACVGIGPGMTDSTYYWIVQVNGGSTDTIVQADLLNFIEGGIVDISKSGSGITITAPNTDTDVDSVTLIGLVLHVYEDDKDRTVDLESLLDSALVRFETEDSICRQGLLVLNDTTFGITECNSVAIKDTICISALLGEIGDTDIRLDSVWRTAYTVFFKIVDKEGNPVDTLMVSLPIPNDIYPDSLRFENDTLWVYNRDTTGIIDSLFVVINTDTDVDSLILDGTTLTLYEDDSVHVVDLSGIDTDTDTDDQTIDVFTFDNGTRTLSISLEDDGEATLTVVIPTGDTDTDDQTIDVFSFDNGTRTLSLSIEDDGEATKTVVIPDSDSEVVAYNGLTNQSPDSIKLGGQLVEDTRIRGNDDLPALNEYSMFFDTVKNFDVTASTRILLQKIRHKTLSNYDGYFLTGLDQTSGFFYDYTTNDAGRFLINNLGISMGWGDSSSVIAKSHIYLNDVGTHINPEAQAAANEIDSLDVLTAMNADGRAKWQSAKEARLRDYDLAHLHGDTAMTLIDTLLPLDSISIYKLVWRNGQVRFGLPGYARPIGYDVLTGDSKNTLLDADSASVALQIHGKRSAIDIYQDIGFGTVGPYLHFRNQYADFYHRIINTTGEEELQPMRYDIGVVAKYTTDIDPITYDTTDRAIFTIRANSDAGTINIIDNYIQSDIYTSDRPIDTVPSLAGILAADSIGRFVLVNVDSIGDINIVQEPDADWWTIGAGSSPTTMGNDIMTTGRVRIGKDTLGESSAKVIIYGGTVPLIVKSSSSTNLIRQEIDGTLGNNEYWDHLMTAGQLQIRHIDADLSTAGDYIKMIGGYDDLDVSILTLHEDGDISFGLYPNTRDDDQSSDSIKTIFYPSKLGRLKTASLDSLQAALMLMGGDSLGSVITNKRIVFGGGTKKAYSDALFVYDTTGNGFLGVGTGSPTRTVDVRTPADVAYNTAYFEANQTTTAFTSTFAAFYAANASAITNSWARINMGDGSNAAAAAIGTQIITPASDYGEMTFWTRGTGGFTEKIRIGTNGQITFNTYTGTTYDATPIKILNVDASGLVKTTTAAALTTFLGGPFATSGQASKWTEALNNYYTNNNKQVTIGGTTFVSGYDLVVEGPAYVNGSSQLGPTVGTTTMNVYSVAQFHGSIQDYLGNPGSNAGDVLAYHSSGANEVRWKTITAGSGIAVSAGATTINISASDVSATNEIQDLGTGTRTTTTYPITISGGGVGITLPTFSSTLAGLVPAPNPAGSTRYLREDGTWQVPPGGGGGSEWTDAGVYIHPNETSDGVLLGSNVAGFNTEELNIVGTQSAIDIWGTTTSEATPYGSLHFKNTNHSTLLNKGGQITVTRTGTSNGRMALSYFEGSTERQFLVSGTAGTTLRGSGGAANVLIGSFTAASDDLLIIPVSSTGVFLAHESRYDDGNHLVFAPDGNIGLNGQITSIIGNTNIQLNSPSTLVGTGSHQLNIRTDGTSAKLGHEAQGNSWIQFQQSQGNIVISNSGVSTSQISIASHGNLSLNSTNGWVQVNLSDFHVGADLTGTFDFEVNGTQASTSATTFTLVSDRRLKEQIEPIRDAYEKIKKLNPVTFHYTKDHLVKNDLKDYNRIGYIAQEYQTVFPDYVDQGEYLSINHDAIGPYTVAAVQQLIKEKEQMQLQISVLMNQIEKMNQRILKLEK